MIEDSKQLESAKLFFRKKLLDWWESNARSFSWRQSSDTYELLIAELLLRRTNAPAAHSVYSEFLEKFPDRKALAEGDSIEIENLVSKLGLFWRAKNMVQLADYFRSGGTVPDNFEALSELPGAGPYVTRAVLVNAGLLHAVPVDTNVVRVLCRYFGLPEKDSLRKNKKFQAFADELAPSERVKEFNYAILDHASMICRPSKPRCLNCPLSKLCAWRISHSQ